MEIHPSVLVVFDFDNTLIDANSDPWVVKLRPELEGPLRTRSRSGVCWTDCMQEIFRSLHASGVTPEMLRNCLHEIPLSGSMKQTLHLLESLPNVGVIIISDANSVFIDIILSHHGLTRIFKTVITNPAQFNEDGLLCVRYHDETGHECDRCSVNLCKGLALQQYLQKNGEEGMCYDKIVYIGDGRGDFCPCLHLSDRDIAMARKHYRLLDMLTEEHGRSQLKAQLIPWDDGNDLLRFFQQTI